MEEKTIIKEELLNKIKGAQSEFSKIQMELGSIEVAVKQAQLRKDALFSQLQENDKSLREALEQIESEYGKGSIDINTGEFIKQEEEESDLAPESEA